MKQRTLVCVLWLSALVVPAAVAGRRGVGPDGRPRDPDAAFADVKVEGGQALMGAQIAEQCMQARPDSLDCLAVHVRARSRLGQCGSLRPEFEKLRQTVWWDAGTALAEGMCWLRSGDLATAFAAIDEAVLLSDRDPFPRFERSIAAIRGGWEEVYEADIAALDELDTADWMADLLRGWQELQARDERLDGTLALYDDGSSQGRQQWSLLSCRRWLDLGDPYEAERVARVSISAVVGQTRLAACRVEALRRVGDEPEAWFVLTRPWHTAASSVALDAVRVRALVDKGDLRAAAELADRLPANADPDVIASKWYLAHAQRDEARAAELAARFLLLNPGVDASALAALAPLGKTDEGGRR